MTFTSFNGSITFDPAKPLYNVACLLAAAAGCSSDCFRFYCEQSQMLRNFAKWFWTNEVKINMIKRIEEAQDKDLLNWYWSNQ